MTAGEIEAPLVRRRRSSLLAVVLQPRIFIPLLFLGGVTIVAILAPLITGDPTSLDPMARMRPPSMESWFGTDQFGRSVLTRTIYGSRVSLIVGFAVATVVAVLGTALGLLAGFLPRVDAVLMRIMDAIMSIPTILLAIAFIALFGAGIVNVIIAMILPEVPRMARVVRGVTLSIRERPYIEAAITNGARPVRLLVRHVLPVAVAPLLVQDTYVFASAVITEAILSFLGAGAPPEIPSWGNIISEGRTLFLIAPWVIIAPGICLSALVLAINTLGDALRDLLDPRLKQQAR
ncbi:ABC transporter permease [Consotaella aegiceratis]|uniref:ABC transporter permease n=1 Tax=Consotaella aegiceratis TaxID=3097961 RepID=UPI002F40DCE1